MRRNAGWLGVTLVVIGVLMLTAATVQAQPGGRGGRGGRGMGDPTAMMQVELVWSTVNFACTLADDQFGTLKAACQKAVDARTTVFTEARQAQDREGIADKLKEINAALEEEVKKLLTEEQLAAVTAWRTEMTASMQKLAQAAMQQGQGQGQGQGQRRGGPMGAIMGALYVDQLWGRATFTAKATDEQLKELRPDFQEEWDLRKEALAAGDLEALATSVEEGRTVLMEALKDVLSEEQMKSMQPRGPGGRGGRGGGQGGGQGGQ